MVELFISCFTVRFSGFGIRILSHTRYSRLSSRVRSQSSKVHTIEILRTTLDTPMYSLSVCSGAVSRHFCALVLRSTYWYLVLLLLSLVSLTMSVVYLTIITVNPILFLSIHTNITSYFISTGCIVKGKCSSVFSVCVRARVDQATMVDNNKEESGNKIDDGSGGGGGGARSNSTKGPRPSTTKEIARAAVEEEFRKKKRKRKRGGGGSGRGGGGDDYGSSSSEEDDADGEGRDKRSRKAKKGDDDGEEDDDRKERAAIEADLASRYRDRAAERRNERGDDNDGDESSKSSAVTTAMNLIVPHNKKGLDLTLARQAKKQIQLDKEGHAHDGGRSHVEYGDGGDEDNTISILERSGPHVLKDFVSKFADGHIVSQGGGGDGGDQYAAIYRNRGMMDYLKLVVSYIEEEQEIDNDDNVEPPRKRTVAETMGRIYDAVDSHTSTARTLQQTQWVLALDGHPSDHPRKAWQVPRQEIQSSSLSSQDVRSSTTKNTTQQQQQLSSETMDQIDRIFRARNRILHDMKKKRGGTTPSASSPRPVSSDAKKNVANVNPTASKQSTTVTQKTGNASQPQEDEAYDEDDDDDDDDIFGGVGDYVP